MASTISRIFRSKSFCLVRPNWSRLRATCWVSVLAPCVAPALDDVDERGDEDAPDVHADMALELGVFGRDDRLAQHRVDVVVADDDAALGGELADDLALAPCRGA